VALNCPSCRRGLPAGVNERCPFCGALLAAPVEGALAPSLRLEPENMEPLREIPGLRRQSRTWKDEVRDRVHQRKQQRLGGELPLFPEEDAELHVPEPELALGDPSEEGAPVPPVALADLGDEPPALARARLYDLVAPEDAAADRDLPLRPRDTRPFEPRLPENGSLLDDEVEEAPSSGWATLDPTTPAAAIAPPERPAQAVERAQAAALDLALLLGLWSLVVYFASRAAHVTVAGLLPSWPYLVAYLAALGFIYAGYFTGTTGQTLGKLALGLRVVNASGQPPGYLRALARALVGSVAVLAAGAGLAPMAFDPARRALHDRILETRVVRL
jgi:uncharacterized RDD family membrane protein YckC